MSGEAFVVGKRHPADLERYAGLEFVRVPPVTDSHSYPAKFDRRLSCDNKNSASSMSSGVVILMFLAEPITTATSFPARSARDASSVPVNPSAMASSKAFLITE